MDVTDKFVSDEVFEQLKEMSKTENFLILDSNWYGGTWSLQDFVAAEGKIKSVATLLQSFSPLERLAGEYAFVTQRKYTSAPKGSAFQLSRGFVDVLTKPYIVCVGYSTQLERLCSQQQGCTCFVQGCVAHGKSGKKVLHANNLIYIKDEKYGVEGFFYCDPRMDSLGFAGADVPCFNSFLISCTDVDAIKISAFEDETTIEMNDFKEFYYSNNPNCSDVLLLAKKVGAKFLAAKLEVFCMWMRAIVAATLPLWT